MANVSSEALPQISEQYLVNFVRWPVFIFSGRMSEERVRDVPLHKHDKHSEVMYAVSGEHTYYIAGQKYIAHGGDLVIFNAGQAHEEHYFSENDHEILYCGVANLQVEGFREYWITPEDVEPVIHTVQYRERIEALMKELAHEGCTREKGFEHICNNLAANLVVLILRIIDAQHAILKPADTLVSFQLANMVKEYIDQHFAGAIRLAQLSDELHVSQYYLSHVFRKEVGVPPKQYLIARRMDEAKRLLLTTDLSIKEVSLRVGYANPNHFFLPFKQCTGHTPLEYRENIRAGIIRF